MPDQKQSRFNRIEPVVKEERDGGEGARTTGCSTALSAAREPRPCTRGPAPSAPEIVPCRPSTRFYYNKYNT